MQSPITVGTILQNRYHIIHIIGQGGFGRTYLAEDQRRFNELCVLKELIAPVMETSTGGKEQELFEREAAILYQIQHPQVPKFREKFAQNERLFLVQDFVVGKTYRHLLNERQKLGTAFTEIEVLHLLRFLLPVLSYIHSQGIIHRDISPENVILRESDSLPVLIDFGVVKELATKLQSSSPSSVTTVGKLGYAPSEQMQTGRVYPSSDLYALAVTAIVLLTGKEPGDLFDEQQLKWNWQICVNVTPGFAEILQRMLSHKPGDRYQSATDVTQALLNVGHGNAPAPNNLSYLQTIAVGNRPESRSKIPQQPEISSSSQSASILDHPLVLGVIGFIVIISAGFGSWKFVSSLKNQPRSAPEIITTPQSFPSPVIPSGNTLTPSPKYTDTNSEPVIIRQSLKLDNSNTVEVGGVIRKNDLIQYTLEAKAGEKLTVSVNEDSGIVMRIFNPNGEIINTQYQQSTSHEGILPDNGRYIIQLGLSSTESKANYSLNVALEPLETPTPTETPTSGFNGTN
ncbi:serine/threonine-protein kinase [Dolichospermum circinale CS-537/03]|uniref:serine/threonine-protein kinase n=1 Tax=Dolichospermum circinale TaxID=109265 RepID=UPI0023309F87|nr:serine/threonine-protein kinase [Dolichospermum circinale]MDB9479372.1 serine/threonine-protein kinase [Dolichospermum circinale CS-537/03]